LLKFPFASFLNVLFGKVQWQKLGGPSILESFCELATSSAVAQNRPGSGKIAKSSESGKSGSLFLVKLAIMGNQIGGFLFEIFLSHSLSFSFYS
jgi:hypothetical protein